MDILLILGVILALAFFPITIRLILLIPVGFAIVLWLSYVYTTPGLGAKVTFILLPFAVLAVLVPSDWPRRLGEWWGGRR